MAFADPSDKNSTFTIAQSYAGGSNYPFSLQFDDKDPSSGDTDKTALNLSVNTATDVYTGALNSTDGSTSAALKFTLTPSTSAVNVTAPSGAEPVANLLSQLDLGGSTSGL